MDANSAGYRAGKWMLSAKISIRIKPESFQKERQKGKKKTKKRKKTFSAKVLYQVPRERSRTVGMARLMLACDSTPENSNCARLKIDVIKVTDAVNFSDRTAYRRRGTSCVVGRCLARTPSELATVTTPRASI